MKKRLKNYFIPHEENGFRPKSLSKKSVSKVMIIAFLIEGLFLLSLFFNIPGHSGFLAAVLPSVLVEDANAEREDLNLSSLKINPILEQAAKIKAEDMANRGYFSHYTPEGNSPWYFLDLVDYKYESAGENLAVNFNDSSATHKAWMNSPTHKANIIEKKFTEIGIATAEGVYKGKKTVFVVEFFATPKDVAVNLPKETKTENAVVVKEKISEPVELVSNNETGPVLGVSYSKDNLVPVTTKELSLFEKIISSPGKTSTMAILALLAFSILAFCLNFFIKIKIQHKDLLWRGSAVIAMLFMFIYINYQLVNLFGQIV